MNDEQLQGNVSVQGGNPEQSVSPVQQVAPINMIPETPGATPIMTGVPRSSIAQAAAEQAARDAVAEAERKKIDPKILAGIIACSIIIIASIFVIIFRPFNPPKGNRGGSGKSSSSAAANTDSESDEDEKDTEEVKTQRIGSAEHGYISVPETWTRVAGDSSLSYNSADGKMVVLLNSAVKSETQTAKTIADAALARAKVSADASQPQMTTEKHAGIGMYKVFSYNTTTKKWSFEFLFDGTTDNRVHSILITADDNTSDLLNSIPDSWSLNQNLKSTSTTEK